jgi:F-box/leucine-rich repeat protein 2/20
MIHAFSSYESRGLLELSLIYCPRVRDSAFLELGRGCSLLRSLYLVDCSKIGDDAMCHIAQGCKNLTEISIRRGYEVTSKFASTYCVYGDRLELFAYA